MRIIVLSSALLLTASAAQAEATIQGALAQCRETAIEHRLACYDSILLDGPAVFPPADFEVEEPVPPPPVTGKWEVSVDQSAITDDKNVYVSLESENYVASKYDTQKARVLARCMENRTSIYFMLGDTFLADIQGYGQVTYRFDKDQAKTIGMDASTDNKALGLWSGAQAIPFMKQMIGKQKLVMRITPFNDSAVEATFDVTNFEAAVKDIRETCKW